MIEPAYANRGDAHRCKFYAGALTKALIAAPSAIEAMVGKIILIPPKRGA